eukprot:6491977-Amphidinium_carterae.1
MADMKKQLADMQNKLGHKPAAMQPPSKGEGKGARRGGGKRKLQELRVLQFWVQACLLQVQGGQGPTGSGAWCASPEGESRCLPGRGPQEAHCCGQGLPGPANAVANCASSCATAKTGNPPTAFQACASLSASQNTCGQDGPTSKSCARSDPEKRTVQGRIGDCLLGLGETAGRAFALAQTGYSNLWGRAWRAPPALLALMNYTKQKAQEGDQEAQSIYEQIEIAREMDQLNEEMDGNGEPASELPTAGDDASMHDASASATRSNKASIRLDSPEAIQGQGRRKSWRGQKPARNTGLMSDAEARNHFRQQSHLVSERARHCAWPAGARKKRWAGKFGSLFPLFLVLFVGPWHHCPYDLQPFPATNLGRCDCQRGVDRLVLSPIYLQSRALRTTLLAESGYPALFRPVWLAELSRQSLFVELGWPTPCLTRLGKMYGGKQSMHRVRWLGLLAHVKARIVKSLHSVGLYGAEVGGIPKTNMTKIRTCARKALGNMTKIRTCARKALGKGAGLRRDRLQILKSQPTSAQFEPGIDASQLVSWTGRYLIEGLALGLSTSAYRQLKLDGQSQKDDRKAALNAALGGVWHEERAHSAFQVGDICVRCGEDVENLEHIVLHCPHWNKERREACLPTHTAVAPACVRLHGLLPAPGPGLLPAHEPAL